MDVLSEYDGSGNLAAEYIYGIDGIVSKFDSTQGHFWFVKDHLGSTRRLDSSSMLRDYYPFGEDYTSAGSETDYTFTGKEKDGSELYYFGARYYDAKVGRWMSVDPMAASYPAWSPYNYTFNNPLRFTDPTGMMGEDENDEQDETEQNPLPQTVEELFQYLANAYGEMFSNAPAQAKKAGSELVAGAKEQAAGVAETGVNTVEVIADAYSDGSTAGAMAGTIGILTGVLTKNPGLALAATEFTATMLASGTKADAVSTLAKSADAAFFNGSKDDALAQGIKTVVSAGSGALTKSVFGQMLTRTSSQITGPLFRSSKTGQFVTNGYGFTATAVSDATRVITNTIF